MGLSTQTSALRRHGAAAGFVWVSRLKRTLHSPTAIALAIEQQKPGLRGVLSAAVDFLERPVPASSSHDLTEDVIRQGANDARWEEIINRGGVWPAEKMDWERYPNRVSNPPPVGADPGEAGGRCPQPPIWNIWILHPPSRRLARSSE